MAPLERAARALAELDIRQKRRWDTEAAELEAILPAAVDYIWRDYEEQARTVVVALREPVDGEDAVIRIQRRVMMDDLLNTGA